MYKISDQIKNIFYILIFIALIIRLGIIIVTYINLDKSPQGDELDYISYANNIIAQGVVVPDISLLRGNAHLIGPGFPLVLATLFRIFGENYFPVFLLNALLSTAVVGLIFFIGRDVFNEKIAIFATGWASFYVLFIKYIPSILKETIILFLFLWFIYSFIKETKRNRISWMSLYPTFIYAYLIHVDERYFSYLPIILIFYILLDRISFNNGMKKAILFFVIVSLLMIPWLIRNYVVYGDRVVILTERTARFTDKYFGYDQLLSFYGQKQLKYSKFKWDESLIDDILAGKEVSGLKGKRYRSLKKGIEAGFIPYKFNTTEKRISNFKELYRPIRLHPGYIDTGFRFVEGAWSIKHNLSVGLSYGLLLPFFLYGGLMIIKYKQKYGLFFICIIIVHTLIHVIYFTGKERYRIPIDTLIILIAFYGLYHISLYLQNKPLRLDSNILK